MPLVFRRLFKILKTMEKYTFLHQTNIIVHVIFGCIALCLGAIILIIKKGGKKHIKIGRLFLFLLCVVVITGLIGVIIFKRNTFLLVLTLLSGYNGYSGFQTIKSKSNKPKFQNVLVSCISLASGIYFWYYINSIGMIWSPIIIYSTLGYLFLIIAYDFLRYLIPAEKYNKLWLYEHIYKMIAAFTALLAAATGTVFPDYKPYSQFLPSILGTVITVGFIIYFYRNRKAKIILL